MKALKFRQLLAAWLDPQRVSFAVVQIPQRPAVAGPVLDQALDDNGVPYHEAPEIHLDLDVEEIQVDRGQSLTVWLGNIQTDGQRTQVELRVLQDGSREVFTDVGARPFSEWSGMPRPEQVKA